MQLFIWRICWFVAVVSSCYGLGDITKYLMVCDRSSPDVNDCLVDAVQDGLRVLANGIKDIGVPAIDPYHQKELRIEYKRNQIMAKMVMNDIYVSGLKNAKVHDVRLRADEDYFHVEVDLTTPRIEVKGQYSGEGQYNSLKISANGEFNTNMTDLVYTWKLDGKPERINNETYVRVQSFYMRPDVGDMKSYVTNNSEESRQLTDIGSRFTNENWRLLYREFLPYAQANWNRIGIRVANKIFLKVPYDQLFPGKS